MTTEQAVVELNTEGGGGFNPRVTPAEFTSALAAEGHSPKPSSFSAAFKIARIRRLADHSIQAR